MLTWDAIFERECTAHVDALCEANDEAQRRKHWQSLIVAIAPHVEQWARGSWVLARWRLAADDEARTVLVAVLERLSRREYDNLHRFRRKQNAADTDLDDSLAMVETAARLAGTEDENDDGPAETGPNGADTDASRPDSGGTPLRAWMLTLVRFCIADHVRKRMGWAAFDGEGKRQTKRDMGTDAARLSDAPAVAMRPPITDMLTVKAFVEEARGFAESFPPEMKSALDLWLSGHAFQEIADAVALDDAASARKLVRAAQARLRQRFRGRWDAVLGA